MLDREATQLLDANGWAVVESAPTDNISGYAHALGDPVPTRSYGPLVSYLRPTSAGDARPGTMSYRYGNGAFPLHTDGAHWRVPPRYVLLRLLEGDSNRPTLLVDSAGMPAEERRLFCDGVWGVKGMPPFLSAGAFQIAGRWVVRFDRCVMSPRNRSAHLAAALLDELCVRKPMEVLWRRGLLLIVDNWRVFHARGAPDGKDEVRVLERVAVRVRS